MANTAKKIESSAGLSAVGDGVRQSAEVKYVGDVMAATYISNSPDFTTTYKNPTDLGTAAEAVLDCQHYDSLLVVVHYTKGAETDLRMRALFGRDDDETKITIQEDREDNSSPGFVAHEIIEHKFVGSGRYYFYVKRVSRFCVLEWKSTGATDATSALAISVFGQARER